MKKRSKLTIALISMIFTFFASSAMAFDLGGLLKDVDKVLGQPSKPVEEAKPTAAEQVEKNARELRENAEKRDRESRESSERNRLAKDSEQKEKEEKRLGEIRSLWLAQDQKKCDAELLTFPKAMQQMSKIKIAGFSTLPIACIGQDLLNQCDISKDVEAKLSESIKDNDFYGDVAVSCHVNGAEINMMGFTSLDNGIVIQQINYHGPLGGDKASLASPITPNDDLYKSLVARYGKPIEIINGNEIVWISSGPHTFRAERMSSFGNKNGMDLVMILRSYDHDRDAIRKQFQEKKIKSAPKVTVPKF